MGIESNVVVAERSIWSPIGRLLAQAVRTASGAALAGLRFDAGPGGGGAPGGDREAQAFLDRVEREVGEYLAGERRSFSVALAPRGTAFRRRVWDALLDIPYGQTISYGELARRVGNGDASRAVGAANGANPIPIIIPCHRVIDSRGRLHGYGGGLERKGWLLRLEGLRVGEASGAVSAGAPLFA